MDMNKLQEKYQKLLSYLKELDSVAIAFSVGVDSTFLLAAAKEALGDKVIALTAKSCLFTDRESGEAEDFCNFFLINTLKTKIIMRLIYNDALNKRIAPYLERLTKKRTSLDKETMALLDVFMQYFNMDTRYGAYSDKLEPCIIYIIQEEKIKSVANLFDGKLNKLLRYLLGDEYAHLFHTYL